MHFSIAPVEISTQMGKQFTTTDTTNRSQATARGGNFRRQVSIMLHGLASKLEPTVANPAHQH